jgi:hypothetical protein
MKIRLSKVCHVSIALVVLAPLTANAYIGPGVGAGVVATVLGILAGIMMLIVGVVWYPIKRLYKWIRGASKS